MPIDERGPGNWQVTEGHTPCPLCKKPQPPGVISDQHPTCPDCTNSFRCLQCGIWFNIRQKNPFNPNVCTTCEP
jgi:hypothetical protein